MFKVLLNPEHGGSDPGAVYGKITEAHLNRVLCTLVETYLNLKNVEIEIYGVKEKWEDLDPYERANWANYLKVDLMLTLAVNAGGGSGLEIYRSPEAFTNTIRYAKMFLDRLSPWYEARNLPVRGIFEKPFIVLEETKMSSLLIEVGFIDREVDRSYLTNLVSLASLALKIGRGIIDAKEHATMGAKEIRRDNEPVGLVQLPFNGDKPKV